MDPRHKKHLLVPENEEGSIVSGFLTVNNTEYTVRIVGISNETEGRFQHKPLAKAEFQCDKQLASLFRDPRVVTARLRLARSTDHFITELIDLIESKHTRNHSSAASQLVKDVPDTEFYQRIISELENLGWDHLVDVNDMMTRLALQYKDTAGRCHVIGFEIPAEYPKSAPRVRHALPVKFEPSWSHQRGDSLASIVSLFQAELRKFQDFWDDFDEVDAQCWVQEPEHPSRAHRHRRVVVAKHCSITVEVTHPHKPRQLPKHRFLGAAPLVAKFQERFNRNAARWDSSAPLLSNLQRLLEVELPSKRTTKSTDYILNCAICYSYRLVQETDKSKPDQPAHKRIKASTQAAEDSKTPSASKVRADEGGKNLVSAAAAALFDSDPSHTDSGIDGSAQSVSIPDQICENANCGKTFHYTCLLEWMQSTPQKRQSFNTLFGDCPYCSSPISIDTLKRS